MRKRERVGVGICRQRQTLSFETLTLKLLQNPVEADGLNSYSLQLIDEVLLYTLPS